MEVAANKTINLTPYGTPNCRAVWSAPLRSGARYVQRAADGEGTSRFSDGSLTPLNGNTGSAHGTLTVTG